MAESMWKIKGLDTEGWVVEAGSVYRPPITARGRIVSVPGQDGVIDAGPIELDEPKLTMVLYREGTAAHLAAAEAALIRGLMDPNLTVTRTIDGVTTSARVRVESAVVTDSVAGRWFRWTLSLAVPGVVFRGADVVSTAVAISNGSVVTVPGLAGSTGRVGDAILRFDGPLTAVQAVDQVTRTGLSWSGAGVVAGQYLYLDAGRAKAWRSTSASQWTPGGTDVTPGLDYVGPRLLVIQPSVAGAARLTVAGSGFSSASKLAVRAAPAWL